MSSSPPAAPRPEPAPEISSRDRLTGTLFFAALLHGILILGIGFLSIVSLMMSAGLAALQKWWGAYLGGWEVLSNILNYLLGFGLATVLFAMIYKIMPRVSVRWSDVWVGAAVTAVLFSAGRLLISLYLGHSAVASGFGAAGSLVVILVWVYYSAQVFLLGAEFTWIYAHTFGSRRHKALPAPGAFSVRAPERKLV